MPFYLNYYNDSLRQKRLRGRKGASSIPVRSLSRVLNSGVAQHAQLGYLQNILGAAGSV